MSAKEAFGEALEDLDQGLRALLATAKRTLRKA
jgi:hypothetical protein